MRPLRRAVHHRQRRHRRAGHRARRPPGGTARASAATSFVAARAWSTTVRRGARRSPRRHRQVVTDGARVIGKNGKVVGTTGPPRLGDGWVPARRAASIQLRAGRAPTAPDEIAINAGLARTTGYARRRPGRRAHPRQPRTTFTVVGIFGLRGRAGLAGRRDHRGLHHAGGAAADARAAPGVFTSVDVTGRYRGQPGHRAARPGRRGGRARRYDVSRPARRPAPRTGRPGTGLRRDTQDRAHRLRADRAVHRRLPHLQHLLHAGRPAHPGAGAVPSVRGQPGPGQPGRARRGGPARPGLRDRSGCCSGCSSAGGSRSALASSSHTALPVSGVVVTARTW